MKNHPGGVDQLCNESCRVCACVCVHGARCCKRAPLAEVYVLIH